MLPWLSSKRFVFQLILIFVIFTLATVIGLGIPVTVLLNRQVESQLRALLDQASQTTVALYENKINQLDYLNALITERPTLNRLVFATDDPIALRDYLDEFLDNVNVDVILVCDKNVPIAMSGASASTELCAPARFNAFTSVRDEIWLLSDGLLDTENSNTYHVVVGQKATTIFKEFNDQSGLDYLLFDERQRSAITTFDRDSSHLVNAAPGIVQYQQLALDTESPQVDTHMAGLIPVTGQEGFRLIGLLNVTEYHALSRDVQNIILGTLLIVSLVAVVIAVLVSRRISQPLSRIARSATALREGDLVTPLSSGSSIYEIDQVTNALEDARVSLKHSLDQLKLEKAWIENLLNAVVEGLLAIDERMRITFASEAIERILEINHSMILDQPVDDIFKTEAGEDLFSHQLPAVNQSRRIPVVTAGGNKLLAVSASRLVPPEAAHATRALVIRDVTDEERIHRLIGEFMANITHEFRTPLSALSASVELLLDQLPELSSAEIEGLLHAINIGIIDLQSLIDNLIEAASIEAGRFKVNPQTIQLHKIIQDALSIVNPIVEKQGLRLIYPDPNLSIIIRADRRRTCQALVNLLSNAIKHSPPNGNITVTNLIFADQVRVEVLDEGQGVPINQRSHLFNRFITPSTESDVEQLGLGLGLSVVKAIIEAQEGTVGFRDREIGGAGFWFTLPLFRGDQA
jgi:signal transduction histidine kinase